MSIPALVAALVGLALLLFAHKFVALLMAGLRWQRRNLPDPSVGLQERIVAGRVFVWFLRIVGALMLLGLLVSVLAPPGPAGVSR